MKNSNSRYNDNDDDQNIDDQQYMEEEKLTAPPDFYGPIDDKERYCTDTLCLFFLILVWIIMTGLGLYAIQNGNYEYIFNPLDYQGNICGTNNNNNDGTDVDMTEYPYLLYVNYYTGGVCVKECPEITENTTKDGLTDMKTLITYTGIYQPSDGTAELPIDYIQVSPYYSNQQSNDTIQYQCTTDTCYPNLSVEGSYTSQGINEGYGYAYYVGDTYEILQRCYLTQDAEQRIEQLVTSDGGNGQSVNNNNNNNNNNSTASSSSSSYFSSFTATSYAKTQQFFTNLYGDLWISRYYILTFGFAVSLFVSLLYMFLLRIPCLLTSIIWGSVAIVISLFALAGYYAYSTATAWSTMDKPPVRESQIDYTFYASYICFSISALLLLLAICLRSSIQVAITCVQQAGKAINAMVFILVVPILQYVGFLVFVCIFGIYAIHLASMGNIGTVSYPIPGSDDIEVTIRVYEYDDFTTYCGWYLLFCFFWTANFIVAVGDMIVAMAISKWYFTIDHKTSSCTVLQSMYTILRYHLGTCAFGSLTIAIVKLIQAIITRFQKRVAQFTNKSLANCLFCCCQCCLCCLERCLKFINKNAYVQCAIFGSPFCESGRKAFYLLLRNTGRVGAVSYVSGNVLFIGKLLISTLTATLSYYFMVEYMQLNLHSFAAPVLFTFIISYFIADMFLDVFELAILTVLHCFVADEEMFGEAKYAGLSMKEWIDKNAAEEK